MLHHLLLSTLLCQAPGPEDAAARELLAAHAELADLDFAALARLDPAATENAPDLLVWMGHSRQLPAAALEPAVRAGMLRFLDDGGGLLLLGHAVAWVEALGLEPVPPDRRDTRLLGNRDLIAGGSYRYGLQAQVPSHPVFAGLAAEADDARGFLLCGSHPTRQECCFWEQARPQQLRTLGLWYRDNFGQRGVLPHCCLVEGQRGKGRVLAYGAFPFGTIGNPHQANLERFLANCLHHLSRRQVERPRVGLLPTFTAQLGVDEYSPTPPTPTPLAPWWQRRGPQLPFVAHWGWHAAVSYQRADRQAIDADYMQRHVLVESAAWGANLVEFYAPDMKLGYAWPWADDDPIPRPARYWGSAFEPRWAPEPTRATTRLAHAYGMLVQSFHHPDPVRGELPVYADFSEWAAREFANPLLYGQAASWDGLGCEWFPADRQGLLTERLWRYNPGAYQYSTSILPAYTPNFSGALMCAFGRLGRINACGFSAQWRDLYHPPLFLGYQADCRSHKPSSRDWGGWALYGGGSFPDWLLMQANDFCRERLELDAALWWLGEPAATLAPQYRQYVYGISMDPIRCAVACGLWSTGRGGYRDVVQGLSADPPPGYASGPAVPMRTAMLQNNCLRLYRRADADRGVLVADPLRLARFDPERTGRERATALDGDLLHSTLAGWQERRLDEPVLDLGVADGSAQEGLPMGGTDGAPGFAERHVVDGAAPRLPQRLAYEQEPRWPTELEIAFQPQAVGRHELEIDQLPESQPSVVVVEFAGQPVGFYVTKDERQVARHDVRRHRFELPVVDLGPQRVLLRVQSGPGHAIDHVAVRRVSNLAIAHSFPLAAGVRARLAEQLARQTDAGVVREYRTYEIDADEARIAITVRCDAAAGACRLHLGLLSATGGFGWQGAAADQPIALGEQPVAFALDGDRAADAGQVEVLELRARTATGGTLPRCFVRELDADGAAWWTERGAQRDGDRELVKRYRRDAGDDGGVRVAEFLPSGFRPGWGCQYALAFAGDGAPGRCTVAVRKTGPFLFAPRVEFERPIRAVRLDGVDWRYFDGSVVFLPNEPGSYTVEVEAGECAAPCLTRTWLTVRRCTFDDATGRLELETAPPSWYQGALPGGIAYTALVRTSGHRLADGAGAIADEELRVRAADREVMRRQGFTLRLAPGSTALRFVD